MGEAVQRAISRCLLAAALSLTACAAPKQETRSSPVEAARIVYVGSYTAPDLAPEGRRPSTARGISVFAMRPSDGHLELLQIVPTKNPSYVALDPSMTHLYCVNQYEILDESPSGRVSAFAIDAGGRLAFLNTRPTHGAHPAHVSVHPSGRYLLVSNYGGEYQAYALLAGDGAIGPASGRVSATGHGPNAERQEAAHPHQTITDPDGRFVFGVDLGADRIFVWRFDPAIGALTPHGEVAVLPGSGPRHMVFHPSRRFAYVLNELAASITAMSYDAERGVLEPRETISTLPPGFAGTKSASELRMHPSGRFLYGTNRGHDSVATFAIDASTGALSSIGWVPTQGETPRGMNVDPTGTFLYAANQNSDTIVIFRIDVASGKLTPTGEIVRTPNPVDIAFGPWRR